MKANLDQAVKNCTLCLFDPYDLYLTFTDQVMAQYLKEYAEGVESG